MFRAIRPSLLSPSVPAIELIKRTVRETIDDDCLSIAAQLAFYFALALFPALLFVVALAGYLPYDVVNDVVAALDPIAPPEVLAIIRTQLDSIVAGEAPSLVTIGILGALWSSSGAMTSIVSALNKAYDLPETRPWWKVRLVAIGLTLSLVAFAVALVHADRGGTRRGSLAGGLARIVRGVRHRMAHAALAADIHAGHHRYRHGVLLRAGRGPGLDLDHARDRS